MSAHSACWDTLSQQDPSILLVRNFVSVSVPYQHGELIFRLKLTAHTSSGQRVRQYHLCLLWTNPKNKRTILLRQTKCLPKAAAFARSQLVMDAYRESIRIWQAQRFIAFCFSILPLAKQSFGVSLRWAVSNTLTSFSPSDYYSVHLSRLLIQVCLSPWCCVAVSCTT